MKKRKLGRLEVPAIGFGCMVLPGFYFPGSEEQAIATLRRAADIGMNFLDTADAYGNGKNEELVARAIKGRRDDFLIATKFGNVWQPNLDFAIDGRPEYVAQACEASLKRLGIEVIDLYYQHRVDPNVPIEDTVGAMKRLVEQGKVRYLGLSEAAPATIRRAHKVHPISALQTEYSLWSRDAETEILPLCRELGIGYVAYSPLGRGIFGGEIKGADSLAENDRRKVYPRYQGENLARNLKMRRRRAARARSSRSRGCWRRASTSCRFPAHARSSTWKPTPRPRTSFCRRRNSRRSTPRARRRRRKARAIRPARWASSTASTRELRSRGRAGRARPAHGSEASRAARTLASCHRTRGADTRCGGGCGWCSSRLRFSRRCTYTSARACSSRSPRHP